MDETQAKPGVGPPPAIEVPRNLLKPLTSTAEAEQISGADKQTTDAVASLTDHHRTFSLHVHSYVREYVRSADQKAAFFFAAATALLAFLHSQDGTARWLKDVRTWSLTDALAFLAMLSLASSACVLLAVVVPRLKGSRRGILFFSAIAEYESAREYGSEVLHQSKYEIVSAELQHSYDLSKVCTRKYRVLRIGFWIGAVGGVSSLLFLLFASTSR